MIKLNLLTCKWKFDLILWNLCPSCWTEVLAFIASPEKKITFCKTLSNLGKLTTYSELICLFVIVNVVSAFIEYSEVTHFAASSNTFGYRSCSYQRPTNRSGWKSCCLGTSGHIPSEAICASIDSKLLANSMMGTASWLKESSGEFD